MTITRISRKHFDLRAKKTFVGTPLNEPLAVMKSMYLRSLRHDINGLLSPVISMNDFFSNIGATAAARIHPKIVAFHKSSKTALEQVSKIAGLMVEIQHNVLIDMPFDPEDEIHRAILSITNAAGTCKISENLQAEGNVRGNPLVLYRALFNILKNAHEALGPEGRISVLSSNVTIDMAQFAEISVMDNGCGMSRDDLDLAFDVGVTTKETGTGLGLFVVLHSVSLLGGLVDVETMYGKGTKFNISIPVSE
ncbi:HAMP domain-containing histidine kinase [Candidatus Micrarchaeota archaeon]|nr:HAMP domain-containing histidine kinase [Candidatus Micrarchaeota archaeon]MBU1682057.1 HAMP domain-containing histidine kinase [Candidatus Micrarchaeota archaeon]